ncbi:MAG: hypothetical protein IJU68_01825 [Bacteroidales bacterium]|nr:hypothetical protein [Bacteroidales bacterium]
MFFERNRLTLPAAVLLAGILALSACTKDKNYEINPSDLDLTMTLLGDGVTIPIGNSNEITLGSLINSAGEGLNDYIKTGNNGELILSYSSNASLSDQIESLDIANMAVIDGVSFSDDFSYHIGDFDASAFNIGAKNYDLKVKFNGMDVLDVKTKEISATADGLNFHAGLDKYKDVISGNADLNLAESIGDILYEQGIIQKATLSNAAAVYPLEEIPVTKELIPDIELAKQDVPLKVDPIKLDDNVTAMTNIETNPNAKLNITLKVINPCLSEGEMTPDINLDFTKLLRIKGGSMLNLKDMKLSSGNGWTLTKAFDVEGLVKTDYEDAFSLNDVVPVTGKVSVSDGAKTTKTIINGMAGDVTVSITARFSDLTIDSADIAVKTDPFNLQDNISFSELEDTQLPGGIEDVKKIILDETKPLKLRITPKNLDRLKQKNLLYKFTLDFPSSMTVDGTTAGKLTFSGDLANGAVEENIVIRELVPTVSGGKLSLDANVAVTAEVEPKNLVLNSAYLPATPEQDLSFTVAIEGTPVIKDYMLVLGNYEEKADLSEKLEFDANGLGDFGGVHIIPEGSPAIVINFDMPSIKGISLTPGKDGIKVVLPDIMVFDASAIAPELSFNASENSITIRNSFPNQITLPLKELYAKPEIIGGQNKIVSAFTASGNVAIPSAEVSQADLKESFGSDIGLTIAVPEIKARSISLDDDLSFDVNQKFNLIIKNLPKELKKINEVVLDEVYANLEASFSGLPATDDSPYLAYITVTLPDFIVPNVIPLKGEIKDGKLSATPVKIEKLANIEPNGDTIESEIIIEGKISADGSKINLATLKPDITASISASIQDKNGKIAVTSATGQFTYELEEKTSIDLRDMPAELRSESTVLDMANPQIDLKMTTNLGIPLIASIDIVPFRAGAEVSEGIVSLKDIRLPYSTDATKKATETFTINDNLSSLLKHFPDSLQMRIKATVDPGVESRLETTAKYILDLDYGLVVPLEFGKDFSFSTSTELDLSGAASLTDLGDFGIKGQVLNDSPLNLNVKIDLLDENGTEIPQSKTSSINIAGASTSDVEFYLSPADRTKKVSKARLNIKVTAIPDKPVKETDRIQFKNLVAVAPEGITVKP